MGILQQAYYSVGPYANTDERRVGKFFAGLSEHHSLPSVRHRVVELIQHDVAIINLWTEYRYKGYRYLRRTERRKLYANLNLIADDFASFRASRQHDDRAADKARQVVSGAKIQPDHATLLDDMMQYFSGPHGRFEYRASSTFGRLLRDPSHERLIGDCNQIVTLYIYLFSRYFDVQDLQLRLLPGHVALHYGGVDIETTSGQWANYESREKATIVPIEEIISINLLDTTDENFATHEVDPKDFLQAARFASILSHSRDIVQHNLEAAYAKLVNGAMDRHDLASALKFARQSRDMTLLSVVGHNGAIYFIQQHDFSRARTFANYAVKKADLIRDSYRAEGVYHYDAHRYGDAIKAFERYGDKELIKRCYEALFFEEQSKLPTSLTSESVKVYASTIHRMQKHAKKSGNHELQSHVDKLQSYL